MSTPATDEKTALPAPVSAEQVFGRFGSFGDSVIQSIQDDDDVLNFLRHFPTMLVYPPMGDDGMPVAGELQIYALPTEVGKFKGVNGRSLKQKCKNDEDMVDYPYAPQVAYPLVDLLHASENMGKVSKGKATFLATALEGFFTQMGNRDSEIAQVFADFDEAYIPLNVKVAYDKAIADGTKEYNDYRAELAKAKAEREAEEG